MGFIAHDAIIVTGSDMSDDLDKARDKALELGLDATTITASKTNGYLHFLVVLDGSKEGWDRSKEGEVARKRWIEWVKENVYLTWIHVRYGGGISDIPNIVEHSP